MLNPNIWSLYFACALILFNILEYFINMMFKCKFTLIKYHNTYQLNFFDFKKTCGAKCGDAICLLFWYSFSSLWAYKLQHSSTKHRQSILLSWGQTFITGDIMLYMKVIKMIYAEHGPFDSSLANHFLRIPIKFSMQFFNIKMLT